MNQSPEIMNELKAAVAFNRQSAIFDEIYSGNSIVDYKRKRVRDHLEQFLKPNSRILELNAGTGDDAIYFAQQGHNVHATDISPGMQSRLVEKVKSNGLEDRVTHELCSFTNLKTLYNRGPYDCIFSNLAGLNCTNELDKVLQSLSPLLKADGIVTLVILPKFCLWETLLFLKGNFKTAFRRFFSSKGTKARVENVYFRCWYYNPSYVKKHTKHKFKVLSTEGLCTVVPPSYIENFAGKYPRLFKLLKALEHKWKQEWPWRSIGDYYIISLRKRG